MPPSVLCKKQPNQKMNKNNNQTPVPGWPGLHLAEEKRTITKIKKQVAQKKSINVPA